MTQLTPIGDPPRASRSFLPLSSALGGYCFLPSAAALIAFVFWAAAAIPETRGKSLDQIAAELRGLEWAA